MYWYCIPAKLLTRRWCGLWERNVQQRSYGDNIQPSYRNVAQHAACTPQAILANPQVRISIGDPGSSITRGKSGQIRDIFSIHRAIWGGLMDKELSQLFEVQYNDRERAELLYAGVVDVLRGIAIERIWHIRSAFL